MLGVVRSHRSSRVLVVVPVGVGAGAGAGAGVGVAVVVDSGSDAWHHSVVSVVAVVAHVGPKSH